MNLENIPDRQTKIYQAKFQLDQWSTADVEEQYRQYTDGTGNLNLYSDPTDDEDFLVYMFDKLEGSWDFENDLLD